MASCEKWRRLHREVKLIILVIVQAPPSFTLFVRYQSFTALHGAWDCILEVGCDEDLHVCFRNLWVRVVVLQTLFTQPSGSPSVPAGQ